MKIVIVSGGKAPSEELLKNEIKDCDYIICADSGANCLYKYNISPNFLLGDFDSIDKNVLEYFKNSKCIMDTYPREKDCTDSELAIKKAIVMKAENVVMLGFTGSRMDHMLGNLGLLKKFLNVNIKACIKDDNNTIMLINKSCYIDGSYGKTISFQAYSDIVKNVTIKGAKYPLNDYDLKLGDSRTISNVFLNGKIHIAFTKGNLLVILPKD